MTVGHWCPCRKRTTHSALAPVHEMCVTTSAVHLEVEMQAATSTWPDGALREPLTSMFSRFARNHDDCANRKSPASTATRVPYLLLIVSLPVQQTHPDSRVKVSAHVYAPIGLHR